ncbi:MAG: CapA family protein [Candidatus Accumulibacter sp.]|nr:CapA family protein [Accumulibacter sp.]
MKKTILLFLCAALCLSARAGDTVSIVAVGDIMLGTAYPSRDFLPANEDCEPLFENVKAAFDGGDVVFANLEGALTDNLDNVKTCSNPDVCYAFAMPTKFAACLKNAGINLMSIANNHTGDFGDKGRESTMNSLKANGIHFAGLTSCATETFTQNGVKYGFAAFAPNSGTVNINDVEGAKEIVKRLKRKSDIVIVSFHGGAEGSKYQHVPHQQENFLGENRGNVEHFAHSAIDAGADIVLGHGPHVSRAIEIYKGHFIAYSMGNFLTYSRINIGGVNGLAPIFRIEMDKSGKFIGGELISTWQQKNQPVLLDGENRVLKVIKDLTMSDFPQMQEKLVFDENGKFYLK